MLNHNTHPICLCMKGVYDWASEEPSEANILALDGCEKGAAA